MKNISRSISIISYLIIILAGEMIGIPFVLWLVFTIFDFGNIDQIFAILGIIGVVLNFSKWKNKSQRIGNELHQTMEFQF